MSVFVKVAETTALAPGEATCVEVKHHKIALFNIDGTYYAIDAACSHRGGPLSAGMIHGAVVTCPWHGATFDVRTGEALSTPAPHGVRSYKVRVEGTAVKIEVPP